MDKKNRKKIKKRSTNKENPALSVDVCILWVFFIVR
jgi:hypothetical protein